MDKLIIRFLFSFLLLCGTLLSCIEPFEYDKIISNNLISIDASLTDTPGEQYITIKKTNPTTIYSVFFLPELKAKVQITEDDKNTFLCLDQNNGKYLVPASFKPKTGSKYRLNVTLNNGSNYESTEEIMLSTPEISSYNVKFDLEAINPNAVTPKPGHLVYISLKDNPELGDNYIWKWRVFEKQSTCATCEESIYVTNPAPLGRCQDVRALIGTGSVYDYGCGGNCWEIINSTNLNIQSDKYSNNKEIKNRLIAAIPFYQPSGFLIEISQQNVNNAAFLYNKLLIEQNQTSGSLADVPPAALIGNIINTTNPKESVGGFFTVGNAKLKRIWVPRTEYDVFQYLNGRQFRSEPASDDANRPPLAPCILSRTRTPFKPQDWPL